MSGGTSPRERTDIVSSIESLEFRCLMAITFDGPRYETVGSVQNTPLSIAVEDFNGDGKQDLAVGSQAPSGHFIQILTGDGTGDFTPGAVLAAGAHPSVILAADFDRDGVTDLVVSNDDENTLSFYRGNSDGTFAARLNSTVGSDALSPSSAGTNHAAAADFNLDGILDIAVTSKATQELVVLVGNGAGRFTRSAAVSVVGQGPLAVADLNGDNIPDVASHSVNSGEIDLYFGNGSGGLVSSGSVTIPDVGCQALQAVDVSGDGSPDLIALTSDGSSALDHLSVFINTGSGAFRSAVNHDAGSVPSGLAVVDLDSDGDLDVFFTNLFGQARTYRNNGNGTFGGAKVIIADGEFTPGTATIAAADVDRDSGIDVLAVVSRDSSPTGAAVMILSEPTPPFATLGLNGTLTINGTNADDAMSVSISGSGVRVNLNDQVLAFDRSAVQRVNLSAGPGNDVVMLGAGVRNPFVDAGLGNDIVDASAVSSVVRITGGSGNDTLIGGTASDELSGGNGKDRLFGFAGNDYLLGGGGNDFAIGGRGDDILSGNGGNDRLFGDSGSDALFGGSGNDVLNAALTTRGDEGRDTVGGGAGSDSGVANNDDFVDLVESVQVV